MSYYQILKVNVFNLFDFSTMGHEMIHVQKLKFAKSVLSQMHEKKIVHSMNSRLTKNWMAMLSDS